MLQFIEMIVLWVALALGVPHPAHLAGRVGEVRSVPVVASPVAKPVPAIVARRHAPVVLVSKVPYVVVVTAPTTSRPPAAPRPAVPTRRAAPVAATTTTTVPSPAVLCAQAVTYLEAHANHAYGFYCRPGALPAGVQAETCNAGCPDRLPEVIISTPACRIAVENEASNTWLDWAHLAYRSPTQGVDDHGRRIDPYGEC